MDVLFSVENLTSALGFDAQCRGQVTIASQHRPDKMRGPSKPHERVQVQNESADSRVILGPPHGGNSGNAFSFSKCHYLAFWLFVVNLFKIQQNAQTFICSTNLLLGISVFPHVVHAFILLNQFYFIFSLLYVHVTFFISCFHL